MRWLLFIGLVLPLWARGQIIATYAGGGTNGLGDGGVATAAQIYDPNGLTLDTKGNLFITENLGNRVRKVDSSNIIFTVAGNGTGGYSGDGGLADTSRVWQPTGVACDHAGNIYIADEHNSRIRRIDVNTGIISTVAGTGIDGYSGDGGPATNAQLYAPLAICFDRWGSMYISDMVNARIRKVDTQGIITTIAGNGTSGSSGDGGPATAAQLWMPYGLAVDSFGNLFIADEGSNKIRKVAANGIITTIAGNGGNVFNGDSISAISASINPIAIAINSIGEILLVDNHNNRIRKVDSLGIIHTVVGSGGNGNSGDGGPAILAEIGNPGGIALDECDNIYVSQVNSPRIRKITFNQNCSVLGVHSNVFSANSVEISIFPNPAKEQLGVAVTMNIHSISIFNTMGQMLMQESCNGEKVVIDTRPW